MRSRIKRREKTRYSDLYIKEYKDIAYEFAGRIYKEFGDFLRAVVLFGATAREEVHKGGDIDILVVVDDVEIELTPDLIEAYRVIMSKIVAQTSKRIHLTTLKLSTFWEYVRAGDPVIVNVLRDGLAIIDKGFFYPLQALLESGRIRPTPESVWSYFSKAPQSLHNARWHLLQATVDLYWGVIDSAHAALMNAGEVPPSPSHIADLLHEKLVKRHILEEHYVTIMRRFYKLAKMIIHQEINNVTGEEFERYYKEADDFVSRVRRILESKGVYKRLHSKEPREKARKKD